MALHGRSGRMLLLQLSLSMVVVILAAAQSLSPPQAKPGCTEKCGNLTIPYPFGIGKACYYEEGFYNIVCNQSESDSPQALLGDGNLVISNFSLEEGEMQVLNYPARDCYDTNAKQTDPYDTWITTLPNHFTFSHTKNKFMAVGCDTIALFQGFRGEEEFWTGCVSFCNRLSSVDQDSCSGVGCCQTNVPIGLNNYSINLGSFNNHSAILGFNPCSYAFIVEEGSFKFSNTSFKELESMNKYPLVLNWAVGNGDQPDSCDAAQKRHDYECKGNSTCANPINRNGYICRCLPGYEGNPYLGCQDTDECKNNPCKNGRCRNEPGNYTCDCDHGYIHENGNMTTCIAHSQSNTTFLKISLGVTMGFLVLCIGISWICCGIKKRQFNKLKEKYFKENGGLLLLQQLANHGGSVETTKIFTTEELEKATNNYHESRVLGEGGYGTVYKGVLPDNKTVAIKKSKGGTLSQSEQFVNEVIVLSQINHRNVVKLLGCCLETEVPLLVYEFITHGTLYEHIHKKRSSLSFDLRMKIAAETAGALAHLHSSISTPIIHRDVKTANILLDENYTAKVSDFGASRLVASGEAGIQTLVLGTFGYLDPEYLQSNQLTEKSDVYSFGVVLVELLTSKVALSNDRCLASIFVSSMDEDCLNQILDDDIVTERNIETVQNVASLAKRCLRVKGEERPTMKEVAMELEGMIIMAKHPWGKSANFCPEENEYLLGSSFNPDGYVVDIRGGDCSSSSLTTGTTTGYDSMQIQMLMPHGDGR